jgi:hypothetical protein
LSAMKSKTLSITCACERFWYINGFAQVRF